MQLPTYIYNIANIFTDYIESAQSVETSHGARDRSPIGEAQDTAAEPDCCSTGTAGDGCSETIANATVLSDEATLRFGLNIEKDIVIRDLYCKGDSEMLAKWPSSINACMKLLKSAGYKDPSTYYICLDKSHPGLWSIMEKADSICKYCSKCGTINYTSFDHVPKYTSGDPRNNALIGHWDGWQPFSTSLKHSCGMCTCECI